MKEKLELLKQALMDGATDWCYDEFRGILTGFGDYSDPEVFSILYWIEEDDDGTKWIYAKDVRPFGIQTGAARLGQI